MFEWLQRELAELKTPRFHVVDGPADFKFREAVMQSSFLVPESYREFILQFGNAKLYRDSRDGHIVNVFAAPREAFLGNGTKVYYLGFRDGASVYVKGVIQAASDPIFEFENVEEKVANSFDIWLRESCDQARKTYGKKWAEIMQGPKPFTPAEQELIETRRRIKWRVLGIDQEMNHIFEVTNSGSCSLPFLTVGIRSRDRRLNGAVRLDTGEIIPGRSAIMHVDCYKNFKPPEEIEAFALPDPQPEDRDYYYEFAQKLHPAT